jgi:hypothetical protein
MGVVSGDPLSIAYYVTGHGLGHATRTIEVRSPSTGRSPAALVCLPAGMQVSNISRWGPVVSNAGPAQRLAAFPVR